MRKNRAAFGVLLLSCLNCACSFDYGGEAAGAPDTPNAVFTGFTHTVMIRGARVLEINHFIVSSSLCLRFSQSGITLSSFL